MFVIAQRANQLSNRLALFAHLIACAAEHDVQLVNLGFEEYAGYFETTRRDLFCRYPAKRSWLSQSVRTRETLSNFSSRVAVSLSAGRLRGLKGSRLVVLRSGYETTLSDPDGCINLDSEIFINILRPQQIIVFLGPLFRDFSSVRKHAASIREYFRPLGIFERNVNVLIQRIREQCDVLVGVHIRQGDYRHFVNGKFFYSDDQYLKLMHRVEQLFVGRQVHFLVCSNEEQSEDTFSTVSTSRGTGHLIEDLYGLARCDYIIGPPSTFSAWASFYGDVPRYTIFDPEREPVLGEFRHYGV